MIASMLDYRDRKRRVERVEGILRKLLDVLSSTDESGVAYSIDRVNRGLPRAMAAWWGAGRWVVETFKEHHP